MWYFPFCVVFEVFHYKADTCANNPALSQVPTYAMYTLMPIYFSTVLISHVGESWESTNTRNLWLFWNVLTPLHRKIVWNKLALLRTAPLIYAFCWIRGRSVRSIWPIAAQNGGIWTWWRHQTNRELWDMVEGVTSQAFDLSEASGYGMIQRHICHWSVTNKPQHDFTMLRQLCRLSRNLIFLCHWNVTNKPQLSFFWLVGPGLTT